ncbi:J domain-containing protein [Humibacter ginsenosidimutans]|uniref:J domain-containing protein n=1 Tax=Humibacter ginsenosidimutans TaxID=2599293 RepID=A0A5B8M125_9MICO|nr:J domain-containing protein [Humibacter ginsenosidimutans]QDZ14023.1 J domain-containing protein [Humibacter ginsenosidimutans]
MTPDEAAAALGVARDASASDILTAYSAKAKEVGGSNAGDPDAEKAEVQMLSEARVTLMTHRQKTQGTQQRTAVAQRAAGKEPEFGERVAAPEPSGWPDDTPAKGKRRSVEEEQSRKVRSLQIGILGLVLAVSSWFWWLLMPLTLFGMGLSIWSLVRVRGYGSGMYTATRIIAWISLLLGAFGLLGNILLIVGAFKG